MIIFDFDGVIANSLSICQAACQFAADEQKYGKPLAADAFADLSPLTFEALGEQLQLDPRCFAADVMRYINDNQDFPPLFDGMAEVLKSLSAQHSIVILSATHTPVLTAICRHHGIASFIRQIIGGDVAGSKGEKIVNLLKPQADADADKRLIMVGDSVSDIDAAHFADIPAVAVTWGWQREDKLRRHGADFVAQTPAELQQILHNAVG